MKILLTWLLLTNIIAFVLFGADKRRAVRNKWRISEKALFLSALIGGSAGALLGMTVFRHKTKHWYFRWGIPLILAVQAILIAMLAYRFAGQI